MFSGTGFRVVSVTNWVPLIGEGVPRRSAVPFPTLGPGAWGE